MPYPGTQSFDGYPISVGGKRLALAPNGHAGPASYVQAATTGDPLQAAEFGMKYIELCHRWRQFQWHPYGAGGESHGWSRLEREVDVVVTATGAEVAAGVNLSTSKVNLLVIGT